jgi:hypothetical protein
VSKIRVQYGDNIASIQFANLRVCHNTVMKLSTWNDLINHDEYNRVVTEKHMEVEMVNCINII